MKQNLDKYIQGWRRHLKKEEKKSSTTKISLKIEALRRVKSFIGVTQVEVVESFKK